MHNWARRPKPAQALAQRARVILACPPGRACAGGLTNTEVARQMSLSKPTVGKPACAGRWRSRFLLRRLDGLLDEPRPGAPRPIGDAEEERVLRLTLETQPRDATHWSTRARPAWAGQPVWTCT